MKLAALVLCVCLLCGCSAEKDPLDQAMDLRNALLTGQECTFSCVISADYAERIYTFQMDCTMDTEGNMSFTVTEPETLYGISGVISREGGGLCFDDKVLAFPMLANDQLIPVSAPWIFLNSLKSGYISGCSSENEGICLYIDDSFNDAVLHMEVQMNSENVPIWADIFWNQKRILAVDIREFMIM